MSASAGRCLEQVITVKPTPWGPLPDPFTLAGDVTGPTIGSLPTSCSLAMDPSP